MSLDIDCLTVTFERHNIIGIITLHTELAFDFFSLLQTVGCRPIASLDHFLPEHLGSAGLVEEVPLGTSKVVKVTNQTKTLQYR